MEGYTITGLRLLHCAGVLFLLLGSVTRGGRGGLSYHYYKLSCPDVETIVREALLPIFVSDPRSPAAFLRLFFHDCQVQGCDASILLNSDESRLITSEMESDRNFGIRNLESILQIKSVVEAECPGRVSCADLITLAAREAVAYSGGPLIPIPLGRMDATTASNRRADAELPSPNIRVDGALHLFLSKGMTVEESVAILGSHTIGVGHCINLVQRLYDTKEEHQRNMESGFKALLFLKCPTKVPLTNLTFILNDLTAVLFDNQYFRDVITGRGLFTIDAGISTDPRTAPIVKQFAEDQGYFFHVFSSAFVKLSSAVVLTREGDAGQIRRQCDRVN